MKATLPGSSPRSAHHCLLTFLDIFESDLTELSASQLKLTEAQRLLLARLRAILS